MRFAIYFSIIALALIGIAATRQGADWLLLWPALSFGVAALAYAGQGPRLFNKRPNGTMGVASITLLLPFLLYTWAIWFLQTHLTAEPAFHQIAPGLWLGRRVSIKELPLSISAVVDLTAEFPAPLGLVGCREYHCLPTLDHEAPPATAFAQMVARLAGYEGNLYLHCALGHGRSAMLAAAILVARGQAADLDTAWEHLQSLRPGVKLSASQKKALRQWQQGYQGQG
jgi:protein-tyrosine phosphatase